MASLYRANAFSKVKAEKPEIPVINGGFLVRLPNMNYHISNNRNNNENLWVGEKKPKYAAGINLVEGSNEYTLLAAFAPAGRSRTAFSKEDAAKELGISVSGAYKLLE